MTEELSAPEKVSNNPQIQEQVNLQKQALETTYPNSNPNIINHWARDKVAGILRGNRQRNEKEQLKKEAAIDERTTLLNPKAYEAEKTRTLDTISRDEDMPSAQGIRFDLDDFGKINKEYGDAAGNEVLKIIGITSKNAVRSSDIVGRIGGEEFEITAPRTKNPNRAQGEKPIPLSEKIRKSIIEVKLEHGIKITASFGVTEYQKGETIENYNNRLENAQIAAKRLGKNRVVEAKLNNGVYIYVDHSNRKEYSVERDSDGKILDPKELING